jgi:hypothetical protein
MNFDELLHKNQSLKIVNLYNAALGIDAEILLPVSCKRLEQKSTAFRGNAQKTHIINYLKTYHPNTTFHYIYLPKLIV